MAMSIYSKLNPNAQTTHLFAVAFFFGRRHSIANIANNGCGRLQVFHIRDLCMLGQILKLLLSKHLSKSQ